MGLGRTPRKTSIILHIWVVEGVIDIQAQTSVLAYYAGVNDDVVSPTLPHVDDVVVINQEDLPRILVC
jgi:hypothetical protein